ncbi:hypothetical protein A2477_01620 [Candidatus Falkowbacteria bacterium RIFOXYC2_FULL_47_12]|uniref:Damage-inducible protein J n=2 Tax=Candidatus Falkowiibacteriota TaxID=1752728 RepID=A0A1F5TMP5_9BACT|nr:MAG: hypothetical protein A2242_03125 [Candidatus Falkowbacteria bacterium RIFOXYA2_FULL_47_9]OGF40245.1 MAG: hypothetical protein A2477_01620 [Candidatus Falkowbacteria bacterium RIFOXYC2_FULL_47_12]
MNTAIINIKTDPKVKQQAQKVAADMGLSLSGIINAYLKQMVREKTILFSLAKKEEPSNYLLAAFKEAEEERKNGEFYSFDDPQKALDFLDELER